MAKSLFCPCGELKANKLKRCLLCQRVSVARSRQKRLASGASKSEVYGYRTRRENLENYLYQSAKQSAKKRDLEFNLDLEDIIIPEVCPVFLTPFENKEKRNPNAPSIDRKDSTKGYVKGNIQILSWRANYLKGDGTAEEFNKLVRFLNAS